MRRAFLALLVSAAFAAPAFAANYPVSGAWGQSAGTDTGPIDCSGKRVINFKGNQRTDSRGGVPAYRNISVTQEGQSKYRIVDEFDTGQIRATATLTLKQVDADRLEVTFLPGGSVTLQKCK